MAKEFAKAFYNSKAWQACRKAYIAERVLIDGGMCETCHEKPGYIVHHKIPLTVENIHNPSVTLNHDNMKFDCKDCHDREETHAFVKQSELKCFFDANGQPVARGTPPPSRRQGSKAKRPIAPLKLLRTSKSHERGKKWLELKKIHLIYRRLRKFPI